MILALLSSLVFQVPVAPTPVEADNSDYLQDISLPTIDGKQTIRLSELRGKPLLLLHFASW